MKELLSSGNRVEVPFLVAEVGGVKLGAFSKSGKKLLTTSQGALMEKTIYPNFVQGATIIKNANGMVNQYTISLSYQVGQHDDPNFIEKLFSKESSGRRMKVSYGDFNNPAHAFREEECLISNVQRQISPRDNRIDYVVSAVSTTALTIGNTWNFAAKNARPSKVIQEILYDNKYGLLDVLPGMKDKDKVNQKGLLSANDIEVAIRARQNISVLEYLKYLVGCMRDSKEFAQPTLYMLAFEGDVKGEMGGAYIKLIRADEQKSLDEWTVDVGYPGITNVFDFKLTENNMYSILYDYNEELQQTGANTTIRELNSKGQIVNVFRQPLAVDPLLQRTTDVAANWWAQMVNYPISGLLTIRGLIRPAVLTSAITINHWFYGKKMNTSGRYRIISDTVRLSASGYFEDLGVLRVGG